MFRHYSVCAYRSMYTFWVEYGTLHAFRIKCVTISYFSTGTYVVCTQKNPLIETVLLSTQSKYWNWWVRKFSQSLITNFLFVWASDSFPLFISPDLSILGYSSLFTSLIVICMAEFQVTRRFLECLFVSVYSEGGKISIVIYIVGVAFYVGLAITCLAGTNLDSAFVLAGLYLINILTFYKFCFVRGITSWSTAMVMSRHFFLGKLD